MNVTTSSCVIFFWEEEGGVGLIVCGIYCIYLQYVELDNAHEDLIFKRINYEGKF